MHGVFHHVFLVVDRHVRLLMRNVETVVMRQDIGIIVYSSSNWTVQTMESDQTVVEVLLITAIVIEEGME